MPTLLQLCNARVTRPFLFMRRGGRARLGYVTDLGKDITQNTGLNKCHAYQSMPRENTLHASGKWETIQWP